MICLKDTLFKPRVWQIFLSKIIEFFFPRYCFSCRRVLALNEHLFCRRCQKQVFLNEKEYLLKEEFFTRVLAPFAYEEPLSQAIKDLKYKNKIHLIREIAKFSRPYFEEIDKSFIVCPVPLHSLRLQERGFNQSLLLARKVFKNHRVEELLLRQKYTKPQVSLKGKERRQNVKGAFRVRYPERVRGQRVLLFDDVLTTGATVTECAKTLIKDGATEVEVAVLARAG